MRGFRVVLGETFTRCGGDGSRGGRRGGGGGEGLAGGKLVLGAKRNAPSFGISRISPSVDAVLCSLTALDVSLLPSLPLTRPALLPTTNTPHTPPPTTVAEQQAQAATELAADSKEQLSATQSELSSLKADLSTAQAKVLELTAEGARLKQQHIKLSKAQQRADDLEGALSATKAKAAASEADYKDCISRVGAGGGGSFTAVVVAVFVAVLLADYLSCPMLGFGTGRD